VQQTNHVGYVGYANGIGGRAVTMLALLAVGFHVPTMPTIRGGIFAGGFWLLALLALWTANFSRSLKIRTGLPYTLTSHNIYTFFQGYKYMTKEPIAERPTMERRIFALPTSPPTICQP
jgi:hypothetical protein